MLNNFPIELRQLKQWVICDMTLNAEGEPKKFPLNPRTGQFADVTNPATWGSFEEAVQTGNPAIGFVITKDDPFTFIDLDDKLSNPASDEDKVRFGQIINAFNSYTELSTSGRGVHIIVKGKIPRGVHRSHVEIYSEGRYMICTGKAIRNIPIETRQELLDVMYVEMQPVKVTTLSQTDGEETDAEICERASNAFNSEKYIRLCNGDITGYKSQSEADFALLAIICFYTKDNEQVRRLFRMTILGKRDKAIRNDKHIDFALTKIRANEPAPIDFDAVKRNVDAIMNKNKPNIQSPFASAPAEIVEAETELDTSHYNSAHVSGYTTPPGLVGDLTEYFLSTAIRPVHEIALAAALAITAGIAGRAFNISGTGLNLYIILLAKTGSGKEGALSGIEKLIAAVRPQIPMIDQFLGPAAFSSGQALIKVLSGKPCFFSVLGEFGLTLQEMSDPRSNSAVRMLKRVLLDLYAKSGATSVLRSSVYSDVEKNTAIVQAPSLTILGESTPETFYEALSEGMIADGLIPRFSIIQYEGGRPPRNLNTSIPPSSTLISNFSTLVAVSLTATNNNTCNVVETTQEALGILNKLDNEADKMINSARNDAEVQLWNRAHLKVLKTAALIAVGVNPHNPIIDNSIAIWAINFVKQDIQLITSKFKEGDVGAGETKQFVDLKRTIESFYKTTERNLRSYNGYFELQQSGLIPHSHVARRLSGMASFRNDKIGSTLALKRNIQVMVDSGMLLVITVEKVQQKFGFGGICYSILKNSVW